MASEMPGWEPAPDAQCARCHTSPVGPGGIICPGCRAEIEARQPRPEPDRERSADGRWSARSACTAAG